MGGRECEREREREQFHRAATQTKEAAVFSTSKFVLHKEGAVISLQVLAERTTVALRYKLSHI